MTARALAAAVALVALAPQAIAGDLTSDQGGSTSTEPAPVAPAADPLARVPRIAVELVLGGASALATAYGGYQLGCALADSGAVPSDCATGSLFGAAIGFGLGIPVGVMLGGALMDGDGGLLPTAFGAGVGLAAVVGAAAFLQRTTPSLDLAPLIAIPLAFAVVGYELSSPDSRSARVKGASFSIIPLGSSTHRGLALGVRF